MHNPFTKSKKEKEENTLATLQVLLFQLGSFFVFFFSPFVVATIAYNLLISTAPTEKAKGAKVELRGGTHINSNLCSAFLWAQVGVCLPF